MAILTIHHPEEAIMAHKIGIIGGNGVAATNLLLDLLEISITKAGAFRDCHHPEYVVSYATKAPSRSMYVEGRGESFVDDYVREAERLKEMGCTMVCMCCNTAHYAIDEIQGRSGVPFINLIEEVAKTVKAMNLRAIGLMASDGCFKSKLYNRYFDKVCPDVRVIYPPAELQAEVTRGICNTKNIHRFGAPESPDRPRNIFSRVRDWLLLHGAEKVISGCTDIRVDFHDEEQIDSLEVLRDAILRHAMEKTW